LQAPVDAGDVADIAAFLEGECDRADLDNLVLAMIEAGGFGIENDAFQGKLGRATALTERGSSFLRMR
jgi:hypothetical protein